MHAQLYIASDIKAAALPEAVRQPAVDVEHHVEALFTIDAARSLREQAAARPLQAEKRSFVISFLQATHEAQNALLKLFEDPPATSQFYIVLKDQSVLLPTLRSRLMLVTQQFERADTKLAKEFLDASHTERIEMIQQKNKEKDAVWFSSVLSGLVEILQMKTTTTENEKRVLLFVESRISARGASKKMLMEHVALSIN